MIDKLDLRVPRGAPFTPAFQRRYSELRALAKSPFRSAKFYEYAGDLREYGHNLRLNLYCQMDKVGNHKIELIDVGTMSGSQILREIGEVFEVPAASLGVMRVDFAVDVPELPVQWFRETVQMEHKRFRSAVTGERFYSEMGTGGIQTLYFGKRPNLIRIYDKQAEYRHQYRNMVRAGYEWPFVSAFPGYDNDTILTRVERQIGGRMPAGLESLAKLFEPGFEYEPFAKLRIIDHDATPNLDSGLTFETLCTFRYLLRMSQDDGMHAVKGFVTKCSNGNSRWVWKKYGPLFSSQTSQNGITGAELQARFVNSLRRQLSN